MASAWGSSWGVSWGDSWGATAVVTPEAPAPGGGFSRRRWHELLEAREAKAEAERAALELKTKKARVAAQKAADAAAKAIAEAEESRRTEELNRDLLRLASLLEGAVSAKKTADIVAKAHLAIAHARAMMRRMEEDEEEEEVIALLVALQ